MRIFRGSFIFLAIFLSLAWVVIYALTYNPVGFPNNKPRWVAFTGEKSDEKPVAIKKSDVGSFVAAVPVGIGDFTILSSDNDSIEVGDTWTAIGNNANVQKFDRQLRIENGVVMMQFSGIAISVPDLKLKDIATIKGYAEIDAQLAKRSGNYGFYVTSGSVKTKPISLNIYPNTSKEEYLLHDRRRSLLSMVPPIGYVCLLFVGVFGIAVFAEALETYKKRKETDS